MEAKGRVVALVRERGLEHRDEPFELSSGELSNDFVDGKRAICDGEGMRTAGQAALDALASVGVTNFDAAGGLTMGADPLAHAIAVVGDVKWFSVRKEAKDHGTGRKIEGWQPVPGARLVLVDDAFTTGGSFKKAYDAIISLDISIAIAGAVALVDRGERAQHFFANLKIPYASIVTYRDLGIPPVG